MKGLQLKMYFEISSKQLISVEILNDLIFYLNWFHIYLIVWQFYFFKVNLKKKVFAKSGKESEWQFLFDSNEIENYF